MSLWTVCDLNEALHSQTGKNLHIDLGDVLFAPVMRSHFEKSWLDEKDLRQLYLYLNPERAADDATVDALNDLTEYAQLPPVFVTSRLTAVADLKQHLYVLSSFLKNLIESRYQSLTKTPVATVIGPDAPRLIEVAFAPTTGADAVANVAKEARQSAADELRAMLGHLKTALSERGDEDEHEKLTEGLECLDEVEKRIAQDGEVNMTSHWKKTMLDKVSDLQEIAEAKDAAISRDRIWWRS